MDTDRAAAYSHAYLLLLPLLFGAGMILIDSLDGILMGRMYHWASVHRPLQKLLFNLSVTMASALIAIVIAVVQVMNYVSEKVEGPFWIGWRETVGGISEYLGLAVLVLFLLGWFLAWVIYERMGMRWIASILHRSLVQGK
jgi:high-affinity nickel-transport protein